MVRPIENISFPHKKVIDVLLVDDDMGFLELEKAFLKKEDDSFQLFTAQSAYEALQRMEEHSFDIIVSDYKMSEIDGLEFLRILREDRSDEIPFIMFTGEGREEVAIKALNLGADRYLQKGGDPRSLYGILSQAVIQEVTHSKTAKKVKELNSLLMSIRNVNQLIVEENDLLTIINKSCETLLETRGYLNIEIALLEDETGNISPVTSSGKHDKAMWEVNLNGEGDAPKCVKDAIKSADTTLIEDSDTYCEGCPYFEDDSNHRTALVPMIHRGETVGLLTACFEPGHIISKKEIELLEEVAADLGFSREKMIADKLLRQREKRLSTILDSIGDAVIVTDKKGKVDFLNPVAEKLTGWDNEEAKGIVLRDVFNIVNNKTREPVKDPVKRVLENGGTVALTNDTVLTSKDGEEYQIADSAAPLIDQNGEVSGVVLVFRDVTEKYDSQKKLKTYSHHLQERVKELDCLYSITKLLEGDRPIDEVLTSAVKVIPEGWQYPETTSAKIKYGDKEYVSDNFDENQCSIVQDIVIGNEVVGNIEVFDLEEENGEPYLEEEYALLSSISNHLTNFLELKKSKLDIKKSRDFYLTILDDFPALIWRSGIDGMCNYFNSTWLDFTGKSIEDELGEGWTEGVDPDDLDRCVNTYLNAFEKREPFEMEYRLLHHSGEYHWIIDFGRPFWDLEGEFAGYIGSCYDIDDRKKMETELRYRLNLESIIAQASSEMVHLSNDEIDGAIDRTLGLIGNFVGIDRSYVFLFDEEDGVINNTHEWCAEGIESQIDKLQDIPISLLSWSMEQLESGLSIHIPRVEDLPPEAEEEKKMSQMQDIQSILLVPLTWKNELKGFMGFDSVKDERSWESEDVILLDTFSDIITNTLERKKAESALKESEERYRELVESSFAGIGITTLDEDFIFVNDRFAEMLGYEKDELIGKNIADICPEDELDIFNKETKIRKKGKRGSYESKLLKNNGNSISVKIYANPYKDSDGSIIGTTGVVTDITNIKKAEHALKESETKIKKLYDSSVVFSSIDNLEELYTKVIEIASDILDFDVCTVSIETNGRLVVKASTEKELVNNYSLPVDEGIVGKTYRKKKSYLIRDVKQDPDSEPTDIRFRSGISLPIGNYGAFQALSYKDEYYDENDLELAELFISHIEEAVRRIEVKERESLLHSLLRHDVKNKAQIVHGYLQLLNDLDISKEGRTFLEKSLKANKDSVNLIDKIGLLIKAKEEKVKEVNLTSVIAETVENFSKFAESKNIEIRTDFSDEVGMVKAGSLLEEVFSNLIENAINHSKCSKIMISRRDQEEFIITSIEDDGIGIPEDKKELIFKKGYTTDKGRGTGLGLFLVKMLLDEYEGDIEVKNSKMDGSKFEVKLKRAH